MMIREAKEAIAVVWNESDSTVSFFSSDSDDDAQIAAPDIKVSTAGQPRLFFSAYGGPSEGLYEVDTEVEPWSWHRLSQEEADGLDRQFAPGGTHDD
jgi:hypothetical protein